MTHSDSITPAEVALYLRFGGDVDGFQRMGTALERSAIREDVWGQLDVLVIELGQLHREVFSSGYAAQVRHTLAARIPDADAREALSRFAESEPSTRGTAQAALRGCENAQLLE